nr:hypothetical protein [uncultured Desulfobacter sp.]
MPRDSKRPKNEPAADSSPEQRPAQTNPGLQDMIKEIGPVFKYTCFRLLSDKTMLLPQGQKKEMPLSGARRLFIMPQACRTPEFYITCGWIPETRRYLKPM